MRKINWHYLLEQEITRASALPFEWGTHDCALFACNAILAMTGDDPAIDFRGIYDSEESANAALEAFAGGGLLETAEKICARLAYPETAPAFAGRGDVALCDLPTGNTLGIVSLNGREVLVAAPHGLLRVPFSKIIKAWKVE